MGGIVAGAIFLLGVLSPIHLPVGGQEINEPTTQRNISPVPQKSQTPTPTPIPEEITHTIEAGQTLYTIAEKYYDDQKYWINLWNDNHEIEDPRLIRIGDELIISTLNQNEVEEPIEKLAKIYEEITNPTPTPTPSPASTLGSQTTVTVHNAGAFDNTYKEAGSKFGVPWEILYGLHIMETGGRDGAITSGYGTGAQGPMQFMPGTWAAYGIDGNSDGVIDINNAVDAIHAAANYISKHSSIEQALKAYGGDSEKALNYARSRGYNQ